MTAPAPTCPLCGAPAVLCNAHHVDGPGPRIHCTSASLHNFDTEASQEEDR